MQEGEWLRRPGLTGLWPAKRRSSGDRRGGVATGSSAQSPLCAPGKLPCQAQYARPSRPIKAVASGVLCAAELERRACERGESGTLLACRGIVRLLSSPVGACAPSPGRAGVCSSALSLFPECSVGGRVCVRGTCVGAPPVTSMGACPHCQPRSAWRPSSLSPLPGAQPVPAAFRGPRPLSTSARLSLRFLYRAPPPASGERVSLAVLAAGGSVAAWARGGRCLTRKRAELGRARLAEKSDTSPGWPWPATAVSQRGHR